jgi:hypothetical protein
VLSDIVKRRSFRANGTVPFGPAKVWNGQGCSARSYRRAVAVMSCGGAFKSAKLDRFRRRIDLEAKLVFLISVLPLQFQLQRAYAEWGWTLIMRAIKCRKGIWWMPWR